MSRQFWRRAHRPAKRRSRRLETDDRRGVDRRWFREGWLIFECREIQAATRQLALNCQQLTDVRESFLPPLSAGQALGIGDHTAGARDTDGFRFRSATAGDQFRQDLRWAGFGAAAGGRDGLGRVGERTADHGGVLRIHDRRADHKLAGALFGGRGQCRGAVHGVAEQHRRAGRADGIPGSGGSGCLRGRFRCQHPSAGDRGQSGAVGRCWSRPTSWARTPRRSPRTRRPTPSSGPRTRSRCTATPGPPRPRVS